MSRWPIQTKADYDRAFDIVRRVIHEWNPYDLVGASAPSDEWDSEIASLVGEIPRIHSPEDAINAVSRIFTLAFQPEGFGPVECAEVGERL
ncbi:MAG TPA: hypothetical protein VGG44_00885, partial [Tepidisphaeraceae bacterium]